MTTAPRTPDPPKRLSALIQLAIEDGRTLPADHRPDAVAYHEPVTTPSSYATAFATNHPGEELPACRVCLAGAVMTGTLGVEANELYHPEWFPQAWGNALQALEYVRTGQWSEAAMTLTGKGLSHEAHAKLAQVPPPKATMFDGRKAFETHLRSLEEASAVLASRGF